MAFTLGHTCDQTRFAYSTITNITVSLLQLHLIRTESVSTSHSGSDKHDRILENVSFVTNELMSHSITLHTLTHGRPIIQHVALLEEHQRLDNVNKPDKIHIICDNQRILVANEEDIQWKSIPVPFHLYVYVRCQSVYGTDHKWQNSLVHRLSRRRILLVVIICNYSLSSSANFIGPPAVTTSHSIGRPYMQISFSHVPLAVTKMSSPIGPASEYELPCMLIPVSPVVVTRALKNNSSVN
ncbi:hypothetical protein T09_4412 [Trichinella sp. T9]|nr:hypothetical protein T09_4412 [Trichinella sp. T9]